MKILFVQWRYHPNRHPIVKALQRGGHNVEYISLYSAENEEYSALKPQIIGYSPIFKFFAKKIGKFDFHTRKMFGWPPLDELYYAMRDFDPDVVVVRDYTITSALALFIGNFLGGDGLLQELQPKFTDSISSKKSIIDSVYNLLWGKPLIRITPVEGDKEYGQACKHVYHIPFTVDIELYEPLEVKDNFKNGQINIISVGSFTSKRKNHIALLESLKSLSNKHHLSVTLVGALNDPNDTYFQEIQSFITRNSLEKNVDIETNMDYQELQKKYKEFDLFVLPAKRERLGMSALEAMAGGLPIICSNKAGIRSYIIEGYNGHCFKEGSTGDLTATIEKVISDREKLIEMKNNSVEIVKQNHHPEVYRKSIEKIVENEF